MIVVQVFMLNTKRLNKQRWFYDFKKWRECLKETENSLANCTSASAVWKLQDSTYIRSIAQEVGNFQQIHEQIDQKCQYQAYEWFACNIFYESTSFVYNHTTLHLQMFEEPVQQ
jgi:hypothetical protein